MKLYELSSEYSNLSSCLVETDIIDEQFFRAKLAEITEQFNVKVENIGKLVLEKSAESKALDEEISRLSNRKRTVDKSIEWFKNYLKVEMQIANVKKVPGEIVTVTLSDAKNSVIILEKDKVPENFRRIVPESWEVDKVSILDNFEKTGEIPEGCNIKTDNKTLRIR